MLTSAVPVIRRVEQFVSDDRRVIPRYLDFGDPARIRSILDRLLALDEKLIPQMLKDVDADFCGRHRDLWGAMLSHYERVSAYIEPDRRAALSDARRLLIGAYFTLEYSIESAALFNPSIVPHPDQSGLDAGQKRFLMSLRATGEGHISSIVFRRGVLEVDGGITLDPPARYAYAAPPVFERPLHKHRFVHDLATAEGAAPHARAVLATLPDTFGYEQLVEALREVLGSNPPRTALAARHLLLSQAKAEYDVHLPDDCLPAEIVLFPATDSEAKGMEDLRLTPFVREDGSQTYYGTYTAYDGHRIAPKLLETDDFHHFRVRSLHGRYARNKGMALFPRQVGGQYVAVSRHDGESLFLLRSDDPYHWDTMTPLQVPVEPWELVQIGNCGSPIETERGWILITHAVGPLRRYCMGAVLLDLDDPSRVIGRLRHPLLMPTAEEREGYVPNVVYSCGAMLHHVRAGADQGDQLFIPYAMSDKRTAFATVSVSELLTRLLERGA